MLPAATTAIICLLMNCKEETTTQSASTSTVVTTTQTTTTIVATTVPIRKYSRYAVLDNDNIYHLYWEPPDDSNPDSEIAFKVEVKAKGFFGLGFSPNGGMLGSDIVTGWIKNGKDIFQDRHGIGKELPPKDASQDYNLIHAYENDTFTVFEFSRKLDTCDKDDMVIEETTMRVIYSYSQDDPEGDDPFYHGRNRGTKSVLLLQNRNNEDDNLNLSSMSTWDIRSPDMDISNYSTLYWCRIIKSPEVSEKQHIVAVKPVIQEGHEPFVHHMVLYECVGGTSETYEPFIEQRGAQCWRPDTPPEMFTGCQGIFIAWTVGGEGIKLPRHVGMPLFPGPPRYFMIEIHYDNPQMQTGIVDSSGLRFYYTPELREYDAGNFVVGSNILPRVFIPPGQEEYVLVGHSHQNCLGSKLPDEGINVFGLHPHAHLAAREIKVRHFRGNTELAPILVDPYYDFNYQESRMFLEEVKILPGDQISVECTYNTSNRNRVTFGGQSTQEEMCMAFPMYYPLLDVYISLSGPTFASINEVLNTNISNEMEAVGALMNYDWGSVDIDEVQNAMRYSKHDSKCRIGYYSPNEEQNLVSYPEDFIPYEPESTCNG